MTQKVHVVLVEDLDKGAPLIVRELLDGGVDVVVERLDDSEALEHALNRSRPLRVCRVDREGFLLYLAARKRLEARHRLLADVGARLVSSVDYPTMLQGVAELVVGSVADWCGIDLRIHRGELQRVAAASSPGRLEPPFEPPLSIARRVVRDRTAELGVEAGAGGASYMVVPLVARGHVLGVMTLVLASAGRTFGGDDLALADDLAARCAMAVDNALLLDQMRDSVRGRDEFIAIAAHELRTPLTPLRMQADLLSSDERTPERLRTPVRQIARASERLAALVERLLDFSRLTIGETRLVLEEHDLVALAATAVDELEDHLGRLGSTIVWNVPEAPLIGRWDGHRVKLAIRNLLENAMKFAPGTPIELSAHAVESHVRLGVKDQGPGLRAEEQARVFDRYGRPAPLLNYGGFGLGLWIVRRVAEEHGGRVEVCSELGRGAEFTLLLPRRSVESTHAG